jgi:hypothetical protein
LMRCHMEMAPVILAEPVNGHMVDEIGSECEVGDSKYRLVNIGRSPNVLALSRSVSHDGSELVTMESYRLNQA